MTTEKRLIDANALIGKARRMETTDNNGIPLDTFAVPVLVIVDAPTVDLVRTTSGAVTTARFYPERTFPPTHYRPTEYVREAGWSRNRHVTHWMPLPEPPKEE